MSKFAPYQPSPETRMPPLEALETRLAGPEDLGAIARIIHARHGGELENRIARLREELALGQANGALFVAKHADRVAGYACILHYDGHEAVTWPSPPGWYCLGSAVTPDLRRRGVALALAAHRLAWLAERDQGAPLYAFVSVYNLASRDLHLRQGYRETGRAQGYLNVAFDGDEGILFRKDGKAATAELAATGSVCRPSRRWLQPAPAD